MKSLVSLIIVFGVFSCCSSKKEINNTVGQPTGNLPKLNEQYYLNNRIKACDKAIDFMRAVIVPDSSGIKVFKESDKFRGIGNIHFHIIGENNFSEIDDLHLFYLNLDCLKQMDFQKLLKLLCSNSDYKIMKDQITTSKQENRFIFEIFVRGMNGFSLVIENNKISNVSWNKLIITP